MIRLFPVCLVSTLAWSLSVQAQSPPEIKKPSQSASQASESQRQIAALQIKQEERQRILGMIPEFNTSNVSDAAKLSARQKFDLAFKSATDPFAFVFSGIDSGISQWENDFPGYGQGAQGYGKRFAASYADSFDGTILGNAVFPILLHQDPRYFRKGTGPLRQPVSARGRIDCHFQRR